MSEQRAKLRLGLFVIASIIAFAGLAILFGGAPQLFSSRSTFTILFPEAPGVSVGTPVRKSGVRIGDVTQLDLDDTTGQVKVIVQIEKKYLPRQIDEPTISRGLLSGDATIDFVPKAKADVNLQTVYYSTSDPIPGVPPLNARKLINEAQDAIPNAQETIHQIVIAFRKFAELAPKIESTLEEYTKLAQGGREMIPELRETNKRLQKLIGNNAEENDNQDQPQSVNLLIQDIRNFVKAFQPVADDLKVIVDANKDDISKSIKSVRQISERVNDLLNDDNRKALSGTLKNVESSTADISILIKTSVKLFDRVDVAAKALTDRLNQAETIFTNIDKATKPIADNAGTIIQNINLASSQLAETLSEVRAVAKQLGNSQGSFRQLLNDPSLYQNLNEAAASITRTLIRAERAAKDLEVFADKIARKPEVLGIGGAIRPSSGLKGSPNVSSTGPIIPSVPIGGPDLGPIYQVNPQAAIPSLPPVNVPQGMIPSQPPPGSVLPMPRPIDSQYRPKVPLPPPLYPENR